MEQLVLRGTPTFKGKKELARYVDPDETQGNRHAAASAFLPTEEDLKNTAKAHLSVNSTEVESRKDIARYFRTIRQNGEGKVALYVNQVIKYVGCGRKAGAIIRSCPDGSPWVFDSVAGKKEDAFLHRPVAPVYRTGRPGSPSHSGIEFIRTMNERQQRKFARCLAKKPRYRSEEHTSELQSH